MAGQPTDIEPGPMLAKSRKSVYRAVDLARAQQHLHDAARHLKEAERLLAHHEVKVSYLSSVRETVQQWVTDVGNKLHLALTDASLESREVMAIRGQVLREVYEITEWKDGAVYRTKHVATVWVWIDTKEAKMATVDGMTYTSPSSKYKGPTIRSIIVPDDESR